MNDRPKRNERSPDPDAGRTEVNVFLASLDHPLLKQIEAFRALVLATDPRIVEGIKWKSPSFYFNDWFATVNLRSTESLQIVLHTGAKIKANRETGMAIDDPAGLLKWLANDRCLLTMPSDPLSNHSASVARIIQQWIALVDA